MSLFNSARRSLVRLTSIVLIAPLIVYSRSVWKRSETADPVFKQIDSIVKTLSEITGLNEEHPVPYGRMSQAQLRRFLAHRIKSTLKPKELYADELTLKLFGLVPESFNLRKSTVDLLTEQAAAFYDYQEKKLFLLDVASFNAEETTLAHELSHALADQHFNLKKFVDSDGTDDDENLAHSAVVEGQATWLMLAYQRKHDGLDGPPSQQQLDAIVNASDGSTPDYPILKSSPLYIQQSLLFPYTEGTRFFDEAYRKLGKSAFSAVFTHAPSDTAQVYHVERYFEHAGPTHPKPPSPAFLAGESELISGSLGEFDQRMLIWQFNGKAEAIKLSVHVMGSEYRIVETANAKKRKHPVLEYVSEWDSEKSAGDYFSAYVTGLRKKWKRCEAIIESATLLSGTSDNGYFITERRGRLVSSVEGIPDEKDWRRAWPVNARPRKMTSSSDLR